MKSKKVLVTAYFAKNLGDDLFLKVLFDRYTNIEWHLLTANRNYKKIFKNYKNVKIIYSYRGIKRGENQVNIFYKLDSLFSNLNKYEALVNIGGSIFMQSVAWKEKYSEREYLLKRFKELNKKVFIIGANFGPFKEEIFEDKYRALFTKYDDICFRDKYSYNLFKDLDNVRVAPDVVFNLEYKARKEKDKVAGFSIIDIENREGLKEYYSIYLEKTVELINKYISLDYKIKLFSFCESEGDMKAIETIKKYINNDNGDIEVVNYEGNINEFLDIFSSCKVIIGARFHSVILAMLFKQAVYPFIYSDKTYNVLKDFGMNDKCCYIRDMNKLNIDEVIDLSFKNILNDKNIIIESKKQFLNLDLLLK